MSFFNLFIKLVLYIKPTNRRQFTIVTSNLICLDGLRSLLLSPNQFIDQKYSTLNNLLVARFFTHTQKSHKNSITFNILVSPLYPTVTINRFRIGYLMPLFHFYVVPHLLYRNVHVYISRPSSPQSTF